MVVSEANKGKSVRPKLSTSDSSDSKAVPKVEKKHRLKQRFEVIKKLGQGTYGKVQLAINKETGQEVSGRHSIRDTFKTIHYYFYTKIDLFNKYYIIINADTKYNMISLVIFSSICYDFKYSLSYTEQFQERKNINHRSKVRKVPVKEFHTAYKSAK
jgi:serine/threonine protein kinase